MKKINIHQFETMEYSGWYKSFGLIEVHEVHTIVSNRGYFKDKRSRTLDHYIMCNELSNFKLELIYD